MQGNMKILQTEIHFDFYDAEQMQKFDIGSNEIIEGINSIKSEKMKQSEFITKFCSIIEGGFDKIFGKGTSGKIFKQKRNFKLCVQAFRDLVKERKNQEKEIDDEIRALQNEIQMISYDYSTERIK